jgi:putative addiction module killer protein
MFDLRQTPTFERWLTGLRDRRAQARIAMRLDRLEEGHLGDVKYFAGIGELRIDYGPGYRIYFVRRDDVIVVLLCGGDKSSQTRDIAKARHMAEEY